jgi:hypothetical protein
VDRSGEHPAGGEVVGRHPRLSAFISGQYPFHAQGFRPPMNADERGFNDEFGSGDVATWFFNCL